MKLIDKLLGSKLKKEQKAFNKIKLLEIVISIIFIIVGIIIFMNKTMSATTISIILGIIVLLESALNIYSFVMSNSNRFFRFNMIFGILYLIISLLLFTNLIKFVNALQIYYSFYLMISGIKLLVLTINLKIIKDESFLIMLAMTILNIALGGLLLFYPFQSFTITEVIAVFTILIGLLNINNSNLLKGRVKKIIK